MAQEERSLIEGFKTLLAQAQEQARAFQTASDAFFTLSQCIAETSGDVRETVADMQRLTDDMRNTTADMHVMAANAHKRTADLREALNGRLPLLSIPTELLQKILGNIPDSATAPSPNVLPPTWRPNIYDTGMLIPASQTCRRLRDVALGCPTLWTSLVDGPRACARLFAQRSRGLPMKVFLPIGEVRGENYHLIGIAEDLPARVQELHVGDLPSGHTVRDLNYLFADAPLPLLESLSLQFCDNPLDVRNQEQQYLFGLPLEFTLERAPRLRRLHLGSCDFVSRDILSSLTHLALHSITVAHVHKKVQAILSACQALESLHLEQVMDLFSPPEPPPWDVDVRGFFHPTPPALPALRTLRRVTLREMYGYLASFILFLVLGDQTELALQLRGLRTLPKPALPNDLLAGTTRLALERCCHIPDYQFYHPSPWKVTAISPARTFCATATELQEFEAFAALLLDGTHALSGVRELWIADAPLIPEDDDSLSEAVALVLKAAIAAMLALDTVVLTHRLPVDRPLNGRPSLRLLPDTREPIAWPPISTVRVACGYDPAVQHLHANVDFVAPLDLSDLLAELASGAYDYLAHLVLEVPRRAYVVEDDLERLRGYLETVDVRVIEGMPEMALPAYCVEPPA